MAVTFWRTKHAPHDRFAEICEHDGRVLLFLLEYAPGSHAPAWLWFRPGTGVLERESP